MQLRSVRVLFFCALSATFCVPNSIASPLQPALQAFSHAPRPLLMRAGQGCGWEYPCPPDPYFGPPIRLRGGQADPASAGNCGPLCWLRRFRQGYCGHGCLAYREQARAEAEERAVDAEREERNGEEGFENSEGEDRFERRDGCAGPYCPGSYPPPPPRPSYYEHPERIFVPHYYERPERAYVPPRRHEQPRPADPAPRERFEGPRYPADCSGGGC